MIKPDMAAMWLARCRGNRIAEMWLACYTEQEIAEAVGLTQQAVSAMEPQKSDIWQKFVIFSNYKEQNGLKWTSGKNKPLTDKSQN